MGMATEPERPLPPEPMATDPLGELSLEGVPHSAEESVFLAYDGFVRDFTMLVDVAQLKSEARSRAVARTVERIASQPALGEVLIRNLGIISDPNVVVSRNPEVATNRIIRHLSSQVLEKVVRRGLDVVKASAEPESVSRAPVARMLKHYVSYRNQDMEEQAATARLEARRLLTDPDELERQEETYEWISEADILTDSGLEAQAIYREGVAGAVEFILQNEPQPRPTVPGMERWVRRWAQEDDHTAQIVLQRLLAGAASPEAVTELLYDLALAGFGTGVPHIMDRTAELLSWQTELMSWDSPQGLQKEFARFHEDPEIRRKAAELVDVAFSYQAVTSGRRQRDYGANMYRIHKDTRFHKYLAHQIVHYPDMMEAMGWNPAAVRGGIAGKVILAKQLAKFGADHLKRFKSGGIPAIFTTHGMEVGPLGEWYRDFYASFSTEVRATMRMPGNRTVMAHLNLPGHPTTEITKTTAASAAHTVEESLKTGAYDHVIEARTYWNTLGYLVPEQLGQREWLALLGQNTQMRDDMVVDKRHSLSPRGDHVEVMNSSLRDLGFDSIDFTMHPERRDVTLVSLRVGNAMFRCHLDREYNFREHGTGNNLGLSQTSPFLEFVVLSHLHEIHNTDPSHRQQQVFGMEGAPKRVEHRRAHRRVLPEGYSPTQDQITKIITEYGIDLVRQNRLRQARGERQLITWVSEVKPEDIVGRGPVYSRGDKASLRLHDILRPNLAAASQ